MIYMHACSDNKSTASVLFSGTDQVSMHELSMPHKKTQVQKMPIIGLLYPITVTSVAHTFQLFLSQLINTLKHIRLHALQYTINVPVLYMQMLSQVTSYLAVEIMYDL